MHTIFYSWQSDIRAAANRTLILNALELAVKEIQGPGGKTIINPVIDRDTAGVPGAPNISSTILNKIDSSSVVVADITLINNPEDGRRTPNPNVLVEVGYAIKSLGFSRILLIQNTFNGGIEDLPFDLRGHRVMTYASDPGDNNRADQKKALAKKILEALLGILPILEDVDAMENDEEKLDVEAVRQEILRLHKERPNDLSEQLEKIVNDVESSRQTPPETRAELLNFIVDWFKKRPEVSNEYLYDLVLQSIKLRPTSSAFFSKDLFEGQLGKPYDSIGSYMKAIDLGDPNPSLCYLNAGNRYRDLNDVEIALAFYDKSVKLNPKQANAWLAGAQLSAMVGDTKSAIQYYRGFLEWFENLPERFKDDVSRVQQASQAKAYIERHAGE